MMKSTHINVLLFEDDESQAILTREALEQERCAVEVSADGETGLKRLFEKEFDAFLIDIKLPDISGVEILRRINMIRPGALCIIVTGHGDEAAAVEAMKLGAYDYVVKSPNLSHLAALPMLIREGMERSYLKNQREQLQSEIWEYSRLLEERNLELQRLKHLLTPLQQLQADIISMITYQLRDPLTTIKQFSGIISDGIAGPTTDAQKRYLDIINENINRLARMIEQLLEMADIESRQFKLSKRFCHPDQFVMKVVHDMRPLAEGKGVQLLHNIPQCDNGFMVDDKKVGLVLRNLIDNAIKYTPANGRVVVSVEETDSAFLFSVEDTGRGIEEIHLLRLFQGPHAPEVFDNEKAPDVIGAGLPMCRRIVGLHGGRIWAESRKGEGSAFFFVLPKQSPSDLFRDCVHIAIERAKVSVKDVSFVGLHLEDAERWIALHGEDSLGKLWAATERILSDTIRHRQGDMMVTTSDKRMLVVVAQMDKASVDAMVRRIEYVLGTRPPVVGGTPLDQGIRFLSLSYPEDAADVEGILRGLMQSAPAGKKEDSPKKH